MRKEGLPVKGLCVAAGIPSTEKAVEIIEGLKATGSKHVTFKPGSVDGIHQVVNIAHGCVVLGVVSLGVAIIPP